MDKNKVVEFVKTHKKEIAIAAGLTVVGIAVAKTFPKGTGIRIEKIHTSELGKFESVMNLWKETQPDGETWINTIAENLTAADLGRLGEEMMKVKSINPDTVANVIVGFKTK